MISMSLPTHHFSLCSRSRSQQVGMATGQVRGGFDKNPPAATPTAPVQTRPWPQPRVNTHRVSGGFQVTRGFEQSGGEFNHKGTMY
jgi:hypothetical protein